MSCAMPVRVVFEDVAENVTLPKFAPAGPDNISKGGATAGLDHRPGPPSPEPVADTQCAEVCARHRGCLRVHLVAS